MMNNKSRIWRVVDANFNRLGEGMRVIEEIARLILNDEKTTELIKTIRHDTIRADISLNTRLIDGRDSVGDIGIDLQVKGEPKEKELPAILVANSRRAQESLRVLEEMAKLPLLNLNPEIYKKARFDLYSIEKTLFSSLLRKGKVALISGLYVIIDSENLYGRDYLDLASMVIRGGTGIIQLRDKRSNKKVQFDNARKLRDLCLAQKVMLVINDYPDVALAIEADGLHVGQEDLPISTVRNQIPIDMLLGCSASTIEEAIQAERDGADYIGLGPIFPTRNKPGVKATGLEMLRRTADLVRIPIVAIGGLDKDNIKEVMAAGASAAAVISAVANTGDPETATRELVCKLNE